MAKSKTKTTNRRHFVLFNTSLGHTVTPPIPPDFGAAKYTAAQQIEHPGEPMTRVLKDIIRLGKWKVFEEDGEPVMWDVTRQVLLTLENTTKQRIANGDAANLGKGHGDEDLIIESDDLISPIDDIILKDDVLWISSYVTPAQAEYLSNPARKVSVGVLENYLAGDGKRYSTVLAHVAVTDRPVVTGQGRFLALANSSSKSKRASQMDQALIDVLNKLLAAAGAGSIPETITDEPSLVAFLEGVASTMSGGETEPEPEADASGGEPADEAMAGMANMAGRGMAMSNKNADALFLRLSNNLKAEMKPLRDEIESLKTERTNTAKDSYIEFETALGKGGVAAVTLSNKRKIAAQCGWDRAVLEGIHPTITMSNISKGQASGNAPVVPGDSHKAATNDEVAARLKARGIDPKFMPTEA